MTEFSRKELRDLLKSFSEALAYWNNVLKDKEELKKVKSAKVDDPLAELVKLSKLIKAHTTKVGIIFKPDVLEKQAESSFNTLQRLSESCVFLMSLVGQLDEKELSSIFYDEILSQIIEVVASNIYLVNQLIILENSVGSDSQPAELVVESDGRLMSVAKVWSSCDALVKVVNGGKIGALNLKFKQSIALIEDGLGDFEEWAEDPEPMDDPFDLDDSDSESEPVPLPEDQKQELKEFGQLWLGKFKLVKLLFSSTSKSLPSITSGETIDSIYKAQRDIVKHIDNLIVELMMCELGDKVKSDASEITKNCNALLKIVKQVNKSNESKIKWCDAWDSKFRV